MNRAATLERLRGSAKWDVLIAGGGATGLAAALAAACRGHRTVLLEQSYFARSTSSLSR